MRSIIKFTNTLKIVQIYRPHSSTMNFSNNSQGNSTPGCKHLQNKPDTKIIQLYKPSPHSNIPHPKINSLTNTNHSSSRNLSRSRAFNMEDSQPRIKREYSLLYQTSIGQKQLFQKGLKKPQRNMNLDSKISFSQRSLSPLAEADISPRTIKRHDPNRQSENILQLGSKPLLSNRSVQKRNPNLESSFKQTQNQKSLVRDKNKESTDTADYVLKALPNHIATNRKEIQIKFTKKENIHNKQNTIDYYNSQFQSITPRNCKRQFSHLSVQAKKENIEVKYNGLTLKDNLEVKGKHAKNQFNHDFYNIQSRTNFKDKKFCQQFDRAKTGNQQAPTKKSKKVTKTSFEKGPECPSRVSQLRKRFL